MGGAVDKPGAVVNHDDAKKNTPNHPGNSADGQKNETEDDLNFHEVIVQKTIKFVIRKIFGVIEDSLPVIELGVRV